MIPFRKRALLRDFLRLGTGMTGDIQTQINIIQGGGGAGSFSTITASGVINPQAGIQGVATNSSAAAGLIGQFVTATVAVGAAVALTDSTPANVTSISLTAGDWDVSAMVDFAISLAATNLSGGPSLTTNTLPTQPGGAGLGTDALAQGAIASPATVTLAVPPVRVLLGSTTTVFLVASAAFAAGTATAYGTIRARRVR